LWEGYPDYAVGICGDIFKWTTNEWNKLSQQNALIQSHFTGKPTVNSKYTIVFLLSASIGISLTVIVAVKKLHT